MALLSLPIKWLPCRDCNSHCKDWREQIKGVDNHDIYDVEEDEVVEENSEDNPTMIRF